METSLDIAQLVRTLRFLGFFSFVEEFGLYIIVGITLAFLFVFAATSLFARRFERHEGCAHMVSVLRNWRAWHFVFLAALYFFSVGAWFVEKNEWFLLGEFIDTWMAITLVESYVVCAFVVFFTIVAALRYYLKDLRSAGAGVALLLRDEAIDPPSHGSREAKMKLTRLALPPAQMKGVLLVGLVSLTVVFAALWLKSVWSVEVSIIPQAYMASGWSAQSAVEEGDFRTMVLQRKGASDAGTVQDDVKVQYWDKALGYVDYMANKRFVEGYNMYVKAKR